MNTLLLNSILSDDKNELQALKTCPPKSLVEWKEAKNIDSSNDTQEMTGQKCKVEIPDLQPETDSKEKDLMAWELLNNRLKNDSKIWEFFKKVSRSSIKQIMSINIL